VTVPIQIALIPPGSLAAIFTEGRLFQMALAGVLCDDVQPQLAYREFYGQASKQRSTHWLLDNGAWESATLGSQELLEVARRYRATEIMAPDVINDPHATWEKTTAFMKVHRDSTYPLERKPRVAAIAHGSTVGQALDFVGMASGLHQIKTIAIGRAFSRKVGNPTARLELALQIKKRYGDQFQIHLLGFSDEWPTELQHCASHPGLIRSLDTIAPFSYAYYGYPIEAAGRVSVPRPDNYFSLDLGDFPDNLINLNIKTLDRWARTPLM
jgi:hypothetical protein